MKRISLFLLLSALLVSPVHAKTRTFQGSGEVLSADPAFQRVIIKHGPIKDFSPAGETEFRVEDPDLLKEVSAGSLADFTIVEQDGGARIEKIVKTGTAPPKDKCLKVGQAIQDVLVATGKTAEFVTSPIPPAQETVGGAFDATTGVTGELLTDKEVPARQEF